MKQLGLLGKSLSHSFSKEYFTNKFVKENITDFEYINIEIPEISALTSKLNDLPNLTGFNVTIPYKEQILPYLDYIDEEAATIGSVNTVLIRKENSSTKLHGYNTDAYGFSMSIKPFLLNTHDRALVLGSGGASKAVVHSLKKIGIDVRIVGRTRKSGIDFSYSELNAYIIDAHKLIINTTPLGMYPDQNSFPDIPYNAIGNNHLVCDLIYNPDETLFLKKAKQSGAVTLNGKTMLCLQADKAWEIFRTN